jgi:hypothetical protein
LNRRRAAYEPIEAARACGDDDPVGPERGSLQEGLAAKALRRTDGGAG